MKNIYLFFVLLLGSSFTQENLCKINKEDREEIETILTRIDLDVLHALFNSIDNYHPDEYTYNEKMKHGAYNATIMLADLIYSAQLPPEQMAALVPILMDIVESFADENMRFRLKRVLRGKSANQEEEKKDD